MGEVEAGTGLAMQDEAGLYLFFLAVIAMTAEQVIRGPERKPTLAELSEEGAHVVAGGQAVDRQTRLYPLGTARALAHVLRHTTVVGTHLT